MRPGPREGRTVVPRVAIPCQPVREDLCPPGAGTERRGAKQSGHAVERLSRGLTATASQTGTCPRPARPRNETGPPRGAGRPAHGGLGRKKTPSRRTHHAGMAPPAPLKGRCMMEVCLQMAPVQKGPTSCHHGRHGTNQAIGDRTDRDANYGQLGGTHRRSSSGAQALSRKMKKESRCRLRGPDACVFKPRRAHKPGETGHFTVQAARPAMRPAAAWRAIAVTFEPSENGVSSGPRDALPGRKVHGLSDFVEISGSSLPTYAARAIPRKYS